ncbi:MAG: hypothetical protein IKZ46_05785 [Victivallales bacterium]|nr:hypothetical protein [Victivallales bacterium]
MKKFFLTVIVVIFACMVNAADEPVAIQHNSTQPWEKGKGTLGRQAGEQVGQTYYYQRGDVIFGATWGTAHNNQMLSYERVDAHGNNITGWKYENGTFEFTSDYIWTDFASRYDGQSSNYGDIVEFGYYKIVDGQPTATHAVMTVDGTDVTNNSVIFEKGDTIGFYTKMGQEVQTTEIDHYEHKVGNKTYTSDSKDYYIDENKQKRRHNGTAVYKTETVTKTYTTTPGAIDGATVFINNVDTDSRGKDDQYFCLFKNQIDGQKHYEYFLAGAIKSSDGQTYEEFIDQVIDQTGTDPSTITNSDGGSITGQPVPGLLLSMVIGGTAVAFSKKRKKA